MRAEREPFWRNGPTTPIAVENGLRARSPRGGIGASWWSRRFIDVLESFALGTRLTRGKAYARKGQVLTIDVQPGVVSSTVQGSRPRPYTTRIVLDTFKDAQWEAILDRLRGEAVYAARLLAGEMPTDLEDVVTQAGASLFPRTARDLRMTCSCPDVGNPCKHLAATFYLLAESFDDDPWRILLWRGRAQADLLDALSLAGGAAGQDASGMPIGAAAVLVDLPTPALISTQADRFWVSAVHPGRRPVPLDAPPDLLLRQLPGPPQAIGGTGLAGWLATAYQAMGSIESMESMESMGSMGSMGSIESLEAAQEATVGGDT